MVEKEQNDERFINNRYIHRFTIADTDADPTGATPFDLTGIDNIVYTLCRLNANGAPITSSPVVTKTLDPVNGVTIVGSAADGVVEVEVDAADTAALTPNDYYIELEVFDADGGNVVAIGTLTLLPNVVHS